jgi:TetR/AcrR family transcriptional repressor of nem operon
MSAGRPIEYDPEQVLEAAMNLFWRLGYQGTSLNDLMKATALSKSSLYQTFGSKRNLFMRCLEHYQDKTTADLRERFQAAKSGKQFIADTLMWVIDEAKDGMQPQGCLVMNTATEFAQRDEGIANSVTRGLDRYREIFRCAVIRGQEEGSISRDTDVNVLVNYLVTNMSGLRTMVKAGSSVNSLKNMVKVIINALN